MKRSSAHSREIKNRVRIRAEVMANVDLPAKARILYFLIDDKAGEEGECWWNWRKLALAIDVRKAQFFRIVAILKSAGVLTTRMGEGRRIFYCVNSVSKSRLSNDFRSQKVDSQVREMRLSTDLHLITESETETGDFFDQFEETKTPQCFRCRDTGREILGKSPICKCAAGRRLAA